MDRGVDNGHPGHDQGLGIQTGLCQIEIELECKTSIVYCVKTMLSFDSEIVFHDQNQISDHRKSTAATITGKALTSSSKPANSGGILASTKAPAASSTANVL